MVYVDEKFLRRRTCPFALVDSEEYYKMPEECRRELELKTLHEENKIYILNNCNFQRESRKNVIMVG